MQLKTYSAGSMAAVLAQIKTELGPDAVILDSVEEDGRITVTAALERPAAAVQREKPDGAPPPVGWEKWQEEWGAIKQHLLHLMKPSLRLDALPPRQRLAMEFLQGQGVSDEAILALHTRLRNAPDASILAPLAEMVPTRPWEAKNWPQQIHILAGPFGAGKTTVAVRFALMLRKKNPTLRICLINADATRGNGRLLLKHYADLSDLAYKEAGTTMELVSAVSAAEREGFDRILVDLPGLGKQADLATLLQDAGLRRKDAATHLVLPPHYSPEALRALLERYRTPLAGSIVWTKLDEAEQYGQLVSVALETGLPVSALSYGPGLGNSLAPARESMLWRMLFKHELPDAPGATRKNAPAARGAKQPSWSRA